ncbi:MAG: thioredoxin [Bacteroidota bacterium]|nr:thioredoxin [Bacteroidota bacterium]
MKRTKHMTALILLAILFLPACSAKGPEKELVKNPEQIKTTSKMGTIHLTKEAFLEKVVNYETNPKEWKYLGDKPCLIDFYADWCGPCKAVAPILEELAAEYEGKIYIYKINTDEEQELAGAFGIRSIPSILFVPMEGQPRMSMGALPKDQLKKAINEILLNNKE